MKFDDGGKRYGNLPTKTPPIPDGKGGDEFQTDRRSNKNQRYIGKEKLLDLRIFSLCSCFFILVAGFTLFALLTASVLG